MIGITFFEGLRPSTTGVDRENSVAQAAIAAVFYRGELRQRGHKAPVDIGGLESRGIASREVPHQPTEGRFVRRRARFESCSFCGEQPSREKSGCRRLDIAFDARHLPDDIYTFSPTRGEEHWDIIAEAMEPISVFFPAIPRATFASYISGLSTYTPDGTILLGAVPGSSNFFTAAGCCGNGIALSAGIGSAITALVRGNEPVFDITPFAPGRFGSVDPFSHEFRDRCSAARASKSHNTAAS